MNRFGFGQVVLRPIRKALDELLKELNDPRKTEADQATRKWMADELRKIAKEVEETANRVAPPIA
jgi:hypothetical protein